MRPMNDVEKAKFLLDGDLIKASIIGECYITTIHQKMISDIHSEIFGEIKFDYLKPGFQHGNKRLVLIEIEDQI